MLVSTREQHPKEWARTQYNLGTAYWSRLLGERAQNIEEASAAYQHALLVRTREQYPREWAITQNNLGTVFRNRLQGERSQNIEDAIAAYQSALLVYTREQHPNDWARTQDNLGGACMDRLRGERAQNIEDAIAAYQAALLVYTREQHPNEWAAVQNRLGNAYGDRLRGERAQNTEAAIAAYQLALLVYTQEYYPRDWAGTQSNLGSAYESRLQGERAQNIEEAITIHQRALLVYSQERYPEEWAMTQNNLGVAYKNRLRGERAQNVEEAIAAYQLALLVYTQEQHPEKWAGVQNNLGGAYWDRLRGERVQNVEEAIAAYQSALLVYTREQYPEKWAMMQNNLGPAYDNRLQGERAQNIEDAIAAYQRALLVYTREQYPQSCRDTCSNLGDLLYDQKRWAEARSAYEEAHEALILTRKEAIRDESRRQIAQENARLYANLIHCCLKMSDAEAAATYAFSGKSRSLTELLAGDSQTLAQLVQQDPGLSAEWEPMQQFKNELDNLLATLGIPPNDDDSRLPDELRAAEIDTLTRVVALRQAINQRTDTLLFRYPALAAVQPLPALSLSQVQALAGELGDAPLVEYVRHGGGWGAFVVRPAAIHYVPLADDLAELLSKDVAAILDNTFWDQALASQAVALAKMYALLVAPLREHLPPSGELVLAPTQQLHAVPFQALLGAQGRYLAEDYALSFVPSLATLYVLHEQRRQTQSADTANAHRLLSVAYSGQGRNFLANVRPEAQAVRECFAEAVQLLEADALPERVFEAARQPFGAVHVNCHGYFNAQNPVDSALLLAQNQFLTVNDIRLRLRLLGRPLVALSACQTGQTRPEQGDEANGLAWAFLAAGAAAVVASQWSVPDQATRELFEAFYQHRRQAPVSEAEALRRAIAQLRQAGAYRNRPFFWAAFQVIGLPIAR